MNQLLRCLLSLTLPAAIVVLNSCAGKVTGNPALVEDFFPKGESQVQQGDKPFIPPSEVIDALIPDLNQTLSSTKMPERPFTFDIAVHGADAREFFMSLVIDTDENMLVHPDVSGTISLELKNVSVAQVLEAVQKIYGYDFEKMEIGYAVYPATLQTKMFKIDRLDLIREGNSRTQVSSGQITDSSDNTGYSGQDNSTQKDQNQTRTSGSWISTDTKTDFWDELRQSLTAIVSVDALSRVVINRQTGVVVVRAKPMQLREVEAFINVTQRQVELQVIIEAKILEIILDDSHQAGVNWTKLVKRMAEQGSVLTGIAPLSSAVAATANVFTIDVSDTFSVDLGNFDAFVELLETQGKTNILSSPRISTMNNQKAIIKVGRDEYFITAVSAQTVTTGSSTITNPEITWTPFFSGIALDVTPQINGFDDVTLHIHPSITRVETQTKNFVIDNQPGSLPLALNSVRESDSVVHAKNGQLIVIGGLMQDRQEDDKRGVALLTRIPYIGNLFRTNTGTTQKSELVIMLKPTIIAANKDWQDDMARSKKRMKKLENFQLWK